MNFVKTSILYITSFYRLFLFCKFHCTLPTFFAFESSDKLLLCCFSDCFEWIQDEIDFKTAHTRSIFCPCHRHLISLSNESMTSTAYPRSCGFERTLYTTHSINTEKDGYNSTFNCFNTSFYNTHIYFQFIHFCDRDKGH